MRQSNIKTVLIFLWTAFLFVACTKEGINKNSISIIGASINGNIISQNPINIDLDGVIRISFSGPLDAESVRLAFSLSSGNVAFPVQASLISAGTALEVQYDDLMPNTVYTIHIASNAGIGIDGECLYSDYLVSFTTRPEGIISTYAPCISASDNCIYNVHLSENLNSYVRCYSSFPLYVEAFRLENIKNLVISLHGQNRDADAYFNQFSSSLENLDLINETLLIGPWFNNASRAEAGELYWEGNDWRIGGLSSNNNLKTSSFEVLQYIVDYVLESESFPNIENVLISGHSSGAIFCHVASGILETGKYPKQSFYFDVLNSQYFYYPEDLRWDQGLMDFVEPKDCSNFNAWPYGYNSAVEYLDNTSRIEFNNRFLNHNVSYVLGTADIVTTGSLNTTDCGAVLLGEHRFDRGSKIYEFLNRYFNHNHSILTVNNVGHNSAQMFNAPEYRMHLSEILE